MAKLTFSGNGLRTKLASGIWRMSFGWVTPPFCFPWEGCSGSLYTFLLSASAWDYRHLPTPPVSAEKVTARELPSVPLALFGCTIDLFSSYGGVFLFALSLLILINSLLCSWVLM